MKNGYVSVWKTTISGILQWLNDSNAHRDVPDKTYELIQILRQPTQGDTPGGHVTEGWFGIIKISTPSLTDCVVNPNRDPLLEFLREKMGD